MISALELPSPGVYERGKIDLLKILCALSSVYSSGKIGAVATFLGVARKTSRSGRDVSYVEMEAYEENANLEIARICREVAEKHSLEYVGVWHLLGRFYPGEPIVLVATAGSRRRNVLQGLDETVERYKHEPAIFKREVYVDGTYIWVEGG